MNLNVVAATTTVAEVNKDFRFWVNGKYYDAPISNEEVMLNHIIQKDEQRIIFNDLDDYVWNLEIYQSNDDNINFNYDDIDKEILQVKYEDSIGES